MRRFTSGQDKYFRSRERNGCLDSWNPYPDYLSSSSLACCFRMNKCENVSHDLRIMRFLTCLYWEEDRSGLPYTLYIYLIYIFWKFSSGESWKCCDHATPQTVIWRSYQHEARPVPFWHAFFSSVASFWATPFEGTIGRHEHLAWYAILLLVKQGFIRIQRLSKRGDSEAE